MQHSQHEIIEGCQRKKRWAQKALYDRYHPVLMGICMRYAKNRSEAEDILLMGLTRIFKKVDTFTGQGSFDGWMKRIMVNIAIDNYRKNLKHYITENLDSVESQVLNYDYIPDTFTLKDILNTIQQLPDGYRIVFNLFAIEGFSHKEIAEKIEISESTSKSQLMKARKKLQHKLLLLNNIEMKKEVSKKDIRIELSKIL